MGEILTQPTSNQPHFSAIQKKYFGFYHFHVIKNNKGRTNIFHVVLPLINLQPSR